jgi:hypothetical protein
MSGGFLDGFVLGFHDVFAISQNGRETTRRNDLLFRYSRDGTERFAISSANNGIGDIRITTGIQLYGDPDDSRSSVALRCSLKLPTGNSATLHGSGSTDLSLWVTGSDTYEIGRGELTLFGAAGGVVTGKGDVLPDIRRQVVGLGSIGLGWAPLEWFAIKSQLYVHSPFYRDSELHELGLTTLQWLLGFTLGIGDTALDFGVSEDVLVLGTSPDVAFNIAVRTKF